MNGQTSTDEIAATPTGLSAQVGACPAEPDGAEVWAVCCSGGGIRSASYCLGALQALEHSGFLAKAKLILGVSGGSYMAASRALVAHGLESGAGGAGANGPPGQRRTKASPTATGSTYAFLGTPAAYATTVNGLSAGNSKSSQIMVYRICL